MAQSPIRFGAAPAPSPTPNLFGASTALRAQTAALRAQREALEREAVASVRPVPVRPGVNVKPPAKPVVVPAPIGDPSLGLADDTFSSFAQGGIGGIKALVDVFGADSDLSGSLGQDLDYWRARISPERAAELQKQEAEKAELGPDAGVLERAKLFAEQSIRNPLQTVAEGFGNIAPLGGVGKVAGALGVGARAAAVGLGTVMGAGAVKGNIYETTKQALEAQGMAPEEASARAAAAQSYAENPELIGAGAAIGGLSGRLGADEAILAATLKTPAGREVARKALAEQAKGFSARGAASGLLKEGLTEGPQESSETGLGNLGAIGAGAKIDPWEGVLESGVKASIMSAVPGSVGTVLGGRDAAMRLRDMGVEPDAEGLAAATSGLPATDPRLGPLGEPEPDSFEASLLNPSLLGGPLGEAAPVAPTRPSIRPADVAAQIVWDAESTRQPPLAALIQSGLSPKEAKATLARVRASQPKAAPIPAPPAAEVDAEADKADAARRAEAMAENGRLEAEDFRTAAASFDADPIASRPRQRPATPEEAARFQEESLAAVEQADREATETAQQNELRSKAQRSLEDQAYAPLLASVDRIRSEAQRNLEDQWLNERADQVAVAEAGGPAFYVPKLLARAVESNSIKPLVDAGYPTSRTQLQRMLAAAKSAEVPQEARGVAEAVNPVLRPKQGSPAGDAGAAVAGSEVGRPKDVEGGVPENLLDVPDVPSVNQGEVPPGEAQDGAAGKSTRPRAASSNQGDASEPSRGILARGTVSAESSPGERTPERKTSPGPSPSPQGSTRESPDSDASPRRDDPGSTAAQGSAGEGGNESIVASGDGNTIRARGRDFSIRGERLDDGRNAWVLLGAGNPRFGVPPAEYRAIEGPDGTIRVAQIRDDAENPFGAVTFENRGGRLAVKKQSPVGVKTSPNAVPRGTVDTDRERAIKLAQSVDLERGFNEAMDRIEAEAERQGLTDKAFAEAESLLRARFGVVEEPPKRADTAKGVQALYDADPRFSGSPQEAKDASLDSGGRGVKGKAPVVTKDQSAGVKNSVALQGADNEPQADSRDIRPGNNGTRPLVADQAPKVSGQESAPTVVANEQGKKREGAQQPNPQRISPSEEVSQGAESLPAKAPALFVQIGDRRFEVKSFEDASKRWNGFRDAAFDQGAKGEGLPNPIIVDQDGRQVARIAQNGKIFPPAADWRAEVGQSPLYDPSAAPAAESKPAKPAKLGQPAPAKAKPEPKGMDGLTKSQRDAKKSEPKPEETKEQAWRRLAEEASKAEDRWRHASTFTARDVKRDGRSFTTIVSEAKREMEQAQKIASQARVEMMAEQAAKATHQPVAGEKPEQTKHEMIVELLGPKPSDYSAQMRHADRKRAYEAMPVPDLRAAVEKKRADKERWMLESEVDRAKKAVEEASSEVQRIYRNVRDMNPNKASGAERRLKVANEELDRASADLDAYSKRKKTTPENDAVNRVLGTNRVIEHTPESLKESIANFKRKIEEAESSLDSANQRLRQVTDKKEKANLQKSIREIDAERDTAKRLLNKYEYALLAFEGDEAQKLIILSGGYENVDKAKMREIVTRAVDANETAKTLSPKDRKAVIDKLANGEMSYSWWNLFTNLGMEKTVTRAIDGVFTDQATEDARKKIEAMEGLEHVTGYGSQGKPGFLRDLKNAYSVDAVANVLKEATAANEVGLAKKAEDDRVAAQQSELQRQRVESLKEPVPAAQVAVIQKLTIGEYNALKEGISAGSPDRMAAMYPSEQVLKRLGARGLVEKQMDPVTKTEEYVGVLTPAGQEMAKAVERYDARLKNGIPFAERGMVKGRWADAFDKGSSKLIIGKANGRDFHSTGHWIVEGKRPAQAEGIEVSQELPADRLSSALTPRKKVEKVTPAAYFETERTQYVVMSNGSAYNASYFDYVSGLHPDAEFFGAAETDTPVYLKAKDGRTVGVIMPIRHEATPGVQAILDAKPAEAEKPAPAKEAPKAEPKKAVSDAGEKIGGSRKDKWAARGLMLGDLEGMSGGEQAQLVTKENVWPKIDYAARIAAGMEPRAAALLKLIRDRVATAPTTRNNQTNEQARKDFVEVVGALRDLASKAKTFAEVQSLADDVSSALGITTRRGREAFKMLSDAEKADQQNRYEKLWQLYGDKSENPLVAKFSMMRKADKMVAEGWPKKAERATTTTADGETKKIEPSRPHLDAIERTGEDVRAGRDVTSDEFREHFGFRGVEFGNWAANDERQKLLNLAYEALHDLANVMGIPPKAISMKGTLGLALAARGGGKFAAHYEPGKLVINMTKINGAGSLAHEWGHALDHYFGEQNRPDAYQGAARGISGWYDKGTAKLGYLRAEVKAAFERVMETLFKKFQTKAEIIRDKELLLEKAQARLDEVSKMETTDNMSKNSKVAGMAFWNRQVESITKDLAKTRAEMAEDARVATGRSDYEKQAGLLSGKSVNGYWLRPTEMFARAFESFVFDRIRSDSRVSDYLVHGVEADRYSDSKKYKGNPYPTGTEREDIDAAFQNLVDTIQTKETDKGVAMFERRDSERPEGMTEAQWKHYNGLTDAERSRLYPEAYRKAQTVKGAPAGVRVVDFEGDVDQAVITGMVDSGAALAARVKSAVGMIRRHVPDLVFGGWTPAGNFHGVNIDGKVFVNYLATHQLALETVKQERITYAEAFARHMTDVLIHESAHYAVRGHGADFKAEMARITEALGRPAVRAIVRDFIEYGSQETRRAKTNQLYEKALPGWREGERRGRQAADAATEGRGRPDARESERVRPGPRSDTRGDPDPRGDDGRTGDLFEASGAAADDVASPAFVRGADGTGGVEPPAAARKPSAPDEDPLANVEETFIEKSEAKTRDGLNRFGRIQPIVEKSAGIKAKVDFQQHFQGITSRVEPKLEMVKAVIVDKDAEIVAKNRLDFGLAGEYADAKNPKSKMDPAKRSEVLRKVKASGKEAAYEQFRERTKHLQMVAASMRVQAGLETRAAALERMQKRGPEWVESTGKDGKHVHPYLQGLRAVERAILQAERNATRRALAEFVIEANVAGFGSVRKGKPGPQGLRFMVNGVDHSIDLKDARLVEQIKNLSAKETDGLTNTLGAMTRFKSRIETSLSPEFVPRNAFRDWMGAVFLGYIMTGTPNGITKSVAYKVAKGQIRAARGVFRYLKNPQASFTKGSPEWWVKQAFTNGAVPGYFSQVRSLAQQESELREALKDHLTGEQIAQMSADEAKEVLGDKSLSPARKAFKYVTIKASEASRRIGFRKVLDTILWANKIGEAATRANYYQAMVEEGQSPARAGDATRNLFDPSKKAEWKNGMNAAWAFAHSAIEGTAHLAELAAPDTRFYPSRQTPEVRRRAQGAMAALVAGGAAWATMLAGALGDDDDDGIPDADQIPLYVSEKGLVFPGAKGVPIVLPFAQGFNVPFFIGQLISKVTRGTIDEDKAMREAAKAVINAFDPITTNYKVPTVLSPLVDVAANEDVFGRKVGPTKFPGDPRPDSQMAFPNTSKAAKAVAKGLNRATGGSDLRPGAIDIAPDTLEHWAEFLAGGIGRFTQRVVTAGTELKEGQIPKKIPGFSSWTHPIVSDHRNRYYTQAQEVDAIKASVNQKEKAILQDEAKERFPGADLGHLTLPQLRKALKSSGVSEARMDEFQKAFDERDRRLLAVRPVFEAGEKELKALRVYPDSPAKEEKQREIWLRLNRAYNDAVKGSK